MHSLTIAAASTNLPNSPAMLITRQGGRSSYALAVLDVKDESIVKRSAKIVNENLSLGGLEGGQVSPQKYAAHQGCFCGLGVLNSDEACRGD